MLPGAFCIECGYDLRGHRSERCPECGAVVDWEEVVKGRIPWVRRKEIGGVRAFMRTMWMVWRRPDVLGGEIGRRVHEPPAASFVRWSLLLATVVGAVLGTIAAWLGVQADIGWVGRPAGVDSAGLVLQWPVMALSDCWWVGLQVLAAMALGAWMSLIFFRGLMVVGVKGRGRRRRAWRLAGYASAMWPVLAGLVGVACVLEVMVDEGYWDRIHVYLSLLRWMTVVTLVLVAWLGVWGFWGGIRSKNLVRGVGTGVVFGLVMPIVLMGAACVGFWVVGYLAMIIWSVAR